MKLVYLLGTDGAGKTTMARRLPESFHAEGRRVVYVYCQHRPLLVWLLKLPGRLLFMRQADQFKDYEGYKAHKDGVTGKRPRLTRLYATLSCLDVWLQTCPRVTWARWRADVVLLDRYYLDWVVNLGVLQNNSLDGMLRDARALERFLPKAQVHIFLEVSAETAFSRKNDIQSVRYLRERKKRYLQLAPSYRFQIVDANEDAETVFQEVRALVVAALNGSAAPTPAGARS